MRNMKNKFLTRFRWLGMILVLSFFQEIHASLYVINNREPLPVWYSGKGTVVNTAIDIYTSDVQSVCGTMLERLADNRRQCIAVGTLGVDKAFDVLVKKTRMDVSGIEGKWEAFHIEEAEADGVKYLMVAGSDLRGTAYGVLELSRLIGVSPWVWWADVKPFERENVMFGYKVIEQSPSVQYRGIFINDEDWGLNPWSYKNFELSARKGNIGPKTYEKVFELLLRLRANTIWPAMHECTVPFFWVEGNREMADKYGVVIGTSHCEPMMRNSAGEWDRKTRGAYNYKTNREGIQQYWSQRMEQVKNSECMFTVGLRGVHDGRMEGVKDVDEETELLGRVINDQRDMISDCFGCAPADIPQIFVPYKEVLRAYNNGLKLPEDVTLVWCDDNHGYITRLSNADERKRNGGAGVYYHTSYWGKPHDYLWLASTQPGLIYKEMKRAWDYNSRKLWILNVGDIKPGEYITNFFLDMAWNVDFVCPENVYSHQRDWYTLLFGESAGKEIDGVMRGYYRLAGSRKPEHMGWNLVESSAPEAVNGLTPVVDTEYSPFAGCDEVMRRITEYTELVKRVREIRKRIPDNRCDAFFELVEYPVCAAAAMNEKLLYAQLARMFARYRLPVAQEYATASGNAYNRLAALTHYYNRNLSGGKWDGMIDIAPRNLPVFRKPEFNEFPVDWSGGLKIHVEGMPFLQEPADEMNLIFTAPEQNEVKLSFFDSSEKRITWEVVECPDGFSVKEVLNGLLHRTDLTVKMNGKKICSTGKSDKLVLCVGGKTMDFKITCLQQSAPVRREINKMVCFNAADYSSVKGNACLHEGLGHSGKSVLIAAAGKLRKSSPCLNYEFVTETTGTANVVIGTIPVHPANSNGEVRMAVVIDDGTPEIISLKSDFLSKKWSESVLRNQVLTVLSHEFKKAGRHNLKLYAIDEDICFDQLRIDFMKDRKSYSVCCE